MRSLLICIVVAVFLAVAHAIVCYDCESLSDPRCNEYFAPEGVRETDCDKADMPFYLHKYGRRIPATGCITKFHVGIEGRPFFIRRACYFGDLENTDEACEAEDPYVPYLDILKCSVCEGDLCNTDAGSSAKPLTILATLLISCALIFLK